MFAGISKKYRAILVKEHRPLIRARIRLLTFVVMGFIIQRLGIVIFLNVHPYFTGRSAIVLCILLLDLLLIFTPVSRKVLTHILLVNVIFLLWSGILGFAQGLTVVGIQYLLIIISLSYYLLGSAWGLAYSLVNILSIIILILLPGYTGLKITYNDQHLNIHIFNFVLISNFLIILFIHYYFFNAFKRTGQNEQQHKANLKKALRRSQSISTAKTNFLSRMSHELRTPLNAVVAMANILQESDEKVNEKENLEVLLFSANNLMFIINEILDFDKIDSGKIILQKRPLRLDNFLNKIGHAFSTQAAVKGLKFTQHIDKSLDRLQINADHDRLSQIFFNVVANAIKFSAAGTVSLNAELLSQDSTKIALLFTIKDTGISISADQQMDILDPYGQKNSATDQQHYGTGLGLTIANKLLMLNGSHLRIHSVEGEGNTLTFQMKFNLIKDHQGDQIVSPARAVNHLESLRILIAEDNPVNVFVLKKMLSQWNIVPQVTENGKEAIEALITSDFDIILMDINMPVMDGFEASRKIRELPDQKKAQVHIIAVTASTDVDIDTHPDKQYINDCILKPFPPKLLLEKLDLFISRS